MAQSGDFSFRTRPVSPWQGEEPAAWEEPQPCQPGSLEMERRARIKMWIEGQMEGLLPTSHPEPALLSTTPARYGCKTLVAVAEAEPWDRLDTTGLVAKWEEAPITSFTTTYHPETFSQSDGLMLVAEADPFYRLDTTGPVHRIHPRPAAQAVADNSEEEEMMEQAPITQWEEAELASLTATFHSETSSQSGAVLVLVAEADPSHRLDTEPESEPVPVAQAEGDLESSVEVMVESKETAPPKKRGWLQRCLRLLRRAASPLLSCCPYRTTAKMNVLLLKEPRESESGPDPYIKELALYGHSATLIPVLSFKFVSLNVLSDKLFQPEKHGGLIFTSPRAVEAVKMCLESSSRRSEWDAVKDQWNRKSVYVVGKATASLVEDLGLTSCGENSGTADVLSRLIIEREGPEIQPLLFPCGSLKREVLPTALRQNGIPLETLTVYQTSEHPDLEKNITHYFSEQGVPASIAFFSPSGVKFCLNTLKGLAGTKLDKIKLAAVGPTTADALEAEGLRVGCTAEKPTPQHLAKGIAQTLNSTTADL